MPPLRVEVLPEKPGPVKSSPLHSGQPVFPATLRWSGDAAGHLVLIDQTLLPVEVREIDCRNVESVWEAIRSLRVRGAPAIGIAAAYGVCVGIQTAKTDGTDQFFARLDEVVTYLATS